MNGLIGKKLGMTQVFDENGHQVPVTALEVGPCVVVQRKTQEADGYDAVQLGFGEQKAQRLNKAKAGHFKKAGAEGRRHIRELRIDEADKEIKAGDKFDVTIFDGSTHVDVIGVTKGRGFQGVVKRYNMSGGRATHGSGMHRATGSIGMCVSPARVLKNKKMPGHMGSNRITTQNLKIVQIRPEDNVLLVRGSVPGPTGNVVFVRKAIKKTAEAS